MLVLKSKVGLTAPINCLFLPVFGNIGMKVHRGYKIFDFRRREVNKVFDADVPLAEAEKEIAACRTASVVSSAPRFINTGSNSAWYCEEYVSGAHATAIVAMRSSDYLNLYPDAQECLLDLVASEPPQERNLVDHIDALAAASYRHRWEDAGIPVREIEPIDDYLNALRAWLEANTDTASLQLVLTHGDFSLVNAIATTDGLRFIDWEGIARGSILGDVFNFAFTEHYYGRTSNHFNSELNALLEKYRAAVMTRCPELHDAVSLPAIFARRLYYLERVRLLLDRDVSLNLLSVIQKSVAMFNDFDRDTGDVPV